MGTIGFFVVGKNVGFFFSECWQISPGLFCFSFARCAFHYYYFFIFCFKEQSGIQGKALPTAVTQACLAVWNRKMHFPRVTFHLKFKLLEFQEGVGAWVGYMSVYKHKPCQPRAVSIFCIVPIPIFQLLPQQDFFFDFVMFHFPLHPSPTSFKCSLLSFLLFS